MNKKAKRRLAVVGGIVVIAMLVIVAIAGAGGSATSLTVGDVLTGQYESKKVQVSGSVVADSITSKGSEAVFEITPEESDGSETLQVSYDGALPATFGAGVVAICTGTVENGELACSELVTKCPSKYESAEGSLTVKGLLDQADSLVGDEVSLCGYVSGQVNAVDADYRFMLESQGETVAVRWDGGMDEAVTDGTAVVLKGALGEDGVFVASEQPAIDEAVTNE
ncbi:cytochrome c maturation protein CcmE [Collinsella sp. An2]|uniref:cytochrome c maturation protein CcmE n=1 Tax=Collinsella sp. An2 TaxID=1965585 RepID=UPI000B37B150|nr:cytochrome c maturation protein CcmE [Collinsella sp. An2]OUP06812.1 hypothetical protein B5F33_09700 [Collinsella sp. An2]